MYVTDGNKNLPELPTYQENEAGMVGVTVKDRTVLFSQNANVKNSNLGITIRDNGYAEMQCLIADLEPGIWNITGGSGISMKVEAKEGEGVIVFKVAPGTYKLSKVTEGEITNQSFENRELEMYGDFILYNRQNSCYLRCEKPNKLIYGIPYVPADTFLKQANAKYEWDNAKGCAIATRGQNTTELYEGATSYTFKGNVNQLSAPIKMIDGTMYIPVLDFVVFFGYSITYDDIAKILSISITEPSKEITSVVDIENGVYNPITIKASGTDGNLPENTNDFSLDTRWSCEGSDCWIEYDLGAAYDIGTVYMAFHSGTKRQTYIDIEVSTDGINYTQIFTGASSGTSDQLEPFPANCKARYVKVRGHGTSIAGNYWNSIREIIVTK